MHSGTQSRDPPSGHRALLPLGLRSTQRAPRNSAPARHGLLKSKKEKAVPGTRTPLGGSMCVFLEYAPTASHMNERSPPGSFPTASLEQQGEKQRSRPGKG